MGLRLIVHATGLAFSGHHASGHGRLINSTQIPPLLSVVFVRYDAALTLELNLPTSAHCFT